MWHWFLYTQNEINKLLNNKIEAIINFVMSKLMCNLCGSLSVCVSVSLREG